MHARFSFLLSMVYFLITLGLYVYSYKIEQLKIENLIWPHRHQHYKNSVCLGGSVEIDNSRKTLLTSTLRRLTKRRLTMVFVGCQFQLLPSKSGTIYIVFIPPNVICMECCPYCNATSLVSSLNGENPFLKNTFVSTNQITSWSFRFSKSIENVGVVRTIWMIWSDE